MPKNRRQPEALPPAPSRMAHIVERNIRALLARRHTEQAAKAWPDRLADAVTEFAGSLRLVWIHLVLFGGWIAWNRGWLGLRPFDPALVVLAMATSVEAIIRSTVLISQNRTAALTGQWAGLNPQVSLLAGHEITRLVEQHHKRTAS